MLQGGHNLGSLSSLYFLGLESGLYFKLPGFSWTFRPVLVPPAIQSLSCALLQSDPFPRLSQARLHPFMVALLAPTAQASKFCFLIWLLLHSLSKRNSPHHFLPCLLVQRNDACYPWGGCKAVFPASLIRQDVVQMMPLHPGVTVKLLFSDLIRPNQMSGPLLFC